MFNRKEIMCIILIFLKYVNRFLYMYSFISLKNFRFKNVNYLILSVIYHIDIIINKSNFHF